MNVEKYRSVADLQDLTSEQVGKIATAQAIEAAIFEYNYQFNLATQTQMSYHELIYTIIVTGVSTAISMGATLCVGKVVQLTGSLTNTAAKELSKSASKTLLALLQPTAGFTVSSVAWAVVREIGQEVLIDPWIESAVSGWVRRAGGDAMMQMVLSSVAESLRETLTGPFTNLFSSQQSGGASLYEQLDAKYFSNGLKPTIQDLLNSFNEYKAEIEAQMEQRKEQMTALGKGFKTLTFVLGAVGFGVAQFVGPPTAMLYTTLATFCYTEEISLKGMFSKAFNPIADALGALQESKIGDFVRNHKKEILITAGIGVATVGMMIIEASLAMLGSMGLGFSGFIIGMNPTLKASQSVMRSNIRTTNVREVNELISAINTAASDIMQKFMENNQLPRFEREEPLSSTLKPYVSKNDPEFRRFENGEIQYGAVIYKYVCKLPAKYTSYSDKIYIGITNNYETRKLNHIRQALNPQERNYKFQDAIYAAFEEEGINPDNMWIDLARSAHNRRQYNLFKEKILRVFDKYFESEILEYHRIYDTAPTREKHYILEFDSKRNGLNEKVGGASKYQPLPLYDIAHLICLGYNVKQITEILNDKYEEFHISRPLISTRLSQIAVFGSFYQAQEELLQPLIEELLEKGIDAYKIFNYLKGNLGSSRRGVSWFTSWAFGDAILKDGITRYFGVAHAEWERVLIEDWNYQKIEEIYGLTEDNVRKVVRNIFGGKHQAMRSLRRSRTLELLKKEWSFKDIYRNDFKSSGTDATMKQYFQRLFKGFNNVNRVWSLEEIKRFANTGFLGTI